FGIAKGAAYSGLLAFLPFLTTVTAVLVQANANSVARTLTNLIFEVVPPGSETMIRDNLLRGGYRPLLVLIGGSLVSLLAASGLMMTLMEGFRAAYGISEGRPFWRQRGWAAVLGFTAALPVVAASALMVIGERGEYFAMTRLGVLPQGEQLRGWLLFFGVLLRYLIALFAIVLSIASLYYFGPNHPARRRHNVWPGAFLATIMWLIATVSFAWYVRNLANYNVMYGSIAAVVALLVWMYVLSVVALFGCEYNVNREKYLTERARRR
ncbi:MAG TPA: YihY/virulence factor BrkB family protein, partial [Bryobacteraceae bacterium]|nr:YihY/virulence factor BrkB family protein [Bryobacteraceae bacterium]